MYVTSPGLKATEQDNIESIPRLIAQSNVLVNKENWNQHDIIDAGTSISPWTTTATLTLAADTRYTSVLNMATSGQVSKTMSRYTFATIPKGGAVVVRIRKKDALAGYLKIDLRCGTFGAPKVYEFNLWNITAVPVNDWFDIVLNPAGASVFPTNDTQEMSKHLCRIAITLEPTAGNDTNIDIAGIWITPGIPEPRVIWQFDDGVDNYYDVAWPILAASGYAGNIPIAWDSVGTEGGDEGDALSFERLDELYAAGWGFSGHADNPVSSVEATARSGWHGYIDLVNAHGWTRDARHWIWPGGSRDLARDTWAREYFLTRRGTGTSITNVATANCVTGYDVPVLYVTQTTTVSTVKTKLDRIYKYGGILHMVYHRIRTPQVAEDWPVANFAEIVAYAKSLRLKHISLDEAYGT